jgi:hypothetical protein
MKYSDGQEVYVGDKVTADKSEGVVVYVINTKQFSDEHPAGSWDYLEKGMMVNTVEMGLVHYPEPDEDVKLVERVDLKTILKTLVLFTF